MNILSPEIDNNMVTAGIDFSHINQMSSYLIFNMRIKQRCNNEQIAQDNFRYTVGIMCWKKGLFVCIAPDKVYILKSNIEKT